MLSDLKFPCSLLVDKPIYKLLSNSYECEVVIKKRKYQSGRHALYGELFFMMSKISSVSSEDRSEYKKYFEDLVSSSEIPSKEIASKLKNGIEKAEKFWNDKSNGFYRVLITSQYEICRYRYRHESDVKKALKESKGKLLVFNHSEIPQWRGKAELDENENVTKVIGKNFMGRIWMQTRYEYL